MPKRSIGDLAGKCGFQRADKCYEHVPEGVLDKEGYKIPRDFNIHSTDHGIEARRLGIVAVNKQEENCQIIDVAIWDDKGLRKINENELTEKYQDQNREQEKCGIYGQK